MNFLITNVTGFRNKGCEAMTKVIISELYKRYNNSRFRIFSNDPEYDTLWCPDDIPISICNTPEYIEEKGIMKRIFNKCFKELGLSRIFLKKKVTVSDKNSFEDIDVIISSGGDIFSSEYGGLVRHLFPIRYASQLMKNIFLVAHSIGPFKSDYEKMLFIRGMQSVRLITVREKRSYDYLSGMNLPNTRIELTADPAFILQPSNKERIKRFCDIYNIPENVPLVGVSVSQGISKYVNISNEVHTTILKEVIEHITQKLKCHVILIPHVHEKSAINDDRIICARLYRMLNYPKDVSVVSMDHSTEDLKGIIGLCDIMIAERMHAAIAALSQMISTIVVGYSIKAKGILSDIFNDTEDYLIDIHDFQKNKIIKKIDHVFRSKDAIADILNQNIPEMKKKAENNFVLLDEILKI